MMKILHKKTLGLFILGVFSALFSSAQNPVISGNSSNPSSCDGWAYLADSSINFATVTWSENGNVIATGINYIDSLCPGTYTVTYTDPTNGTYTFDVTGNGNPCQNYYSSANETDASASGVCDGSATISTYNGTGPYSYSWSNGATTSVLNNLCTGTYTYTVVDANGCAATGAVTVSAPGQFDSVLIITNNNYSNQPVIGSYVATYIDCNIDYDAIGGASVTSTVVLSSPNVYGLDTVEVTWTIVDTSNNVLATYSIDYVVSDSVNGVMEFGLLLYCYQKSVAYTSMMATDRVLFETLSIEETQLENFKVVNPMNEELTVYFGEEVKGSVEIVANNGAIVKQAAIAGQTVSVPAADLQQGIYFVRIVANDKSATVKVVKH